MQLYNQYKGWTRENDTAFTSKAHGRHKVHDYVNGLARSIFRASKGVYPTHSAVAKEGWMDGKRNMVWLMEKRRPGFDKEHGDWWYATVDAQGKVANAGKVEACISCHDSADNDYVFGLPGGN